MKTDINPFSEFYDESSNDYDLIGKSLKGDREALEKLILRHQAWIYNIALRMIMDPVEAEDVTQEIMIKIITKLSSYDASKSSFRTWLYRIVANHVLNVQKSNRVKSITEMAGGRGYHEMLNEIKDSGVLASPERYSMLIESRTLCLSGMLICLDSRQRLVFILAVLFDVSDKTGGEILSLSRANFRKILSRGREKLFNFFSSNCSLLDPSNSCSCSKHAEHLKQLGLIQNENTTISYKTIGDIIGTRLDDMEDYYGDFINLYRQQPLLHPPDQISWIREILSTEHFKDVFHLH